MSEQETHVLYPADLNDDDDLEHDDDVLDAPPTTTLSALGKLKQQRQRIAATRSFDVVVPGWGGLLVLRLGPVTGEQQSRIVERARGSTARVDLDFLVAAFKEVLFRETPQSVLEIVTDDDVPVGLDRRLAEALDLGKVDSARDVMRALFSQTNSPPQAIAGASNEWADWARSANDEIDEDFLGE